MKTKRILLIAVALNLGLAGCQNLVEPSKTTTAFYDNQVKATVGISNSVGSLEKSVTKDPVATDRRVTELETKLQATVSEMDQVRRDADTKNERAIAAAKDAAVKAADVVSALGGGGVYGGLVTSLFNGRAPSHDELKKSVDAVLAEAQKQVAALKADVETKTEIAKQQSSAKEEQLKRDLEAARKEFAVLSEQQQAAARAELVRIAKDKGIAGAEGMTTEQLLVALGGAGLGLAGLLRTFGKSRNASEVEQMATTQDAHAEKINTAASEVDQLWDGVKQIEQKIAVLEHQSEACDCHSVKSDVIKIFSALDDHQRRLGKLGG